MSRPKTHVITFANIKGGVGKTTSVVNLAYLFGSEFGKRVLVIDADDQGNASKSLGVRDQFDPDTETLWYALEQKKSYADVMIESPYENVWVIASTKELKGAQLAFGQSARGLKLFKRLLKSVEKDFDLVLIDTKPQINVLLQAALAASDFYLIPSFPEPDSYDGFVDLVAECEDIYEEENERLSCLGVLLTSVKKIPAHETYVSFIQKHLKLARVPILRTYVRASNSIATGGLQACPAVALPNSHAVREDYMKVARGLLRSLSRRPQAKRPRLDQLGLEDAESLAGLEVQDHLDEIKL